MKNRHTQASIFAHCEYVGHHGTNDWEVTLIEQTDSLRDLKKR